MNDEEWKNPSGFEKDNGGEAVGQAQSTDLGLITVECQFYRSRRDTLISANNRLKASEAAWRL